MSPIRLFAVTLILASSTPGCNPERKRQCDEFLEAMRPLGDGAPTADTVDRVKAQVSALNLSDQPLHIFAENFSGTLTVLSSTLRLRDDPSAPDGTDDVIKTRLHQARTDREDIERYCAQ